MADIIFECPECKEGLAVDAKGAGRIVNCPKCFKKIQIPARTPGQKTTSANVDEIFVKMDSLPTEELIAIWVANDRKQWSDEAFEAVKNILISRNIPVTTPGQPVNYDSNATAPSAIKLQKLEGAAEVIVTDVRIPFWSMVMLMVKWAVAAIPAMIILLLIGLLIFAALGLFFVGLGSSFQHLVSP